MSCQEYRLQLRCCRLHTQLLWLPAVKVDEGYTGGTCSGHSSHSLQCCRNVQAGARDNIGPRGAVCAVGGHCALPRPLARGAVGSAAGGICGALIPAWLQMPRRAQMTVQVCPGNCFVCQVFGSLACEAFFAFYSSNIAAMQGKQFSVIVTEGRPDETGLIMARLLEELRVPVTVILDSGVGYAMERRVMESC